ncbi:hypothetical protein IM816_05680 [Luteibacter flocculans]|uniref:C2H2-type domain-containing protein n=1 Tax=Luteibacter flocculans TaxID=2780091 RepID=A0ABY4T4S1_9GAMM|nr:hypothetical protein [Luteibacter flocculans]URL59586.1 hypothetical protein IM816_05680 [Luteibacter flocculans]
MATIVKSETFEVIHCASCSVSFCMSAAYIAARRSDRKSFYCPNGHSQWFPGETDKDRAQKLAGQLDQERTRLQQERERSEAYANQLAISQRTRKAVSTRLRKVKARVGHGVCPCCNRTFEQLAKHMATKHPSFAKSAAEA